MRYFPGLSQQSPRIQQPPPDYASVTSTVANPVPVQSSKNSSVVASVFQVVTSVPPSQTSTPSKVVVTAENHVDQSPSVNAIVSTQNQNVPPPSTRARRPSSLPYSLRPVTIGTKRSAMRTAIPTDAEISKPKQPPPASQQTQPPPPPPPPPQQQPDLSSRTGQPSRVVAPTATPEDSFVDGPSSSGQCITDAFAVAGTASAVVGRPCVSVADRTHDVTSSSNIAEPAACHADQPSECLFASVSSPTSLSASASHCRQLLATVHGLSRVADNTATTVLQNGKASSGALTSGSSSSSSLSGVGRIQRALSDARHRLFGQRGSGKRKDRNSHKKSSSTVADICDKDLTPSSSTLADERVCVIVANHVTGVVAAPASTTAEGGHTSTRSRTPNETKTTVSCEQRNVEDRTKAPTDSSSKAGNGVENGGCGVDMTASDPTTVPVRYGLSPASSSYDRRHVRFSHIGSHALDVFFSPEESDDDDNDEDTCHELARVDSGNEAASAAGGSRTSLRSVIWRPIVARCSSTALMAASSPSGSLVDDGDEVDRCLYATTSGGSLRSAVSTTASSSTLSTTADMVDRRWNGTTARQHVCNQIVESSRTNVSHSIAAPPRDSDLRNR